jgi:hypothetical protein
MVLSSSIFGSGFEVASPPSQRADLRIEILDGANAYLTRTLQATINTPFSYSIRVRNAGPVDAHGVRLKEFIVGTDAPNPLLSPLVAAGAWSCAARAAGQQQSDPGTSCDTGSGVLSIGSPGFALPAGASRTYTLSRNVPSASNGARSVLAAAVFFDPTDATGQGDISTAENVARAVVQLTENPGPTIACAGLDNLSLTESASPRTFSYTCEVTDANGVKEFVPTSSDGTRVSATVGSPTGDDYPLTLRVPAYAFTASPVVITLNAKDNLDAAATPVQVTVTITQVNDAPSFTMPVKRIELRRIQSSPAWEDPPVLRDADGALIARAGVTAPVALANCLDGGNLSCTIGVPAVLLEVDAGDPGESAQTVEAVASACSGGSVPGFTVGQEPIGFVDNGVPITSEVLGNRGPVPSSGAGGDTQFGLTFTYDKRWGDASEVSCYLKVRDNGSPAATTPDSDGLTRVIFSRFAGS